MPPSRLGRCRFVKAMCGRLFCQMNFEMALFKNCMFFCCRSSGIVCSGYSKRPFSLDSIFPGAKEADPSSYLILGISF